jgi:hypothetical protein
VVEDDVMGQDAPASEIYVNHGGRLHRVTLKAQASGDYTVYLLVDECGTLPWGAVSTMLGRVESDQDARELARCGDDRVLQGLGYDNASEH